MLNKKRRYYPTATKPQTHSNLVLEPPAYPIAANHIFGRIATAVAQSRGYRMSNLEYARIMGKSDSTTSYWLGVSPQPKLVACFCLLEHLTPEERHATVDALCRTLPLLDHPRLAHNPATVAALKNLLRQGCGLTLISGGNAEQRSFLVSAIGHSFCRLDPAHRKPAGIDLYDPAQLVPVDNLTYVRNPHRPVETLAAIHSLWPAIMSTKHPLILLNGVWSLAPKLHLDILTLASRRQVIIADEPISLPTQSDYKTSLTAHQLTVARDRKNPQCLEVSIKVI